MVLGRSGCARTVAVFVVFRLIVERSVVRLTVGDVLAVLVVAHVCGRGAADLAFDTIEGANAILFGWGLRLCRCADEGNRCRRRDNQGCRGQCVYKLSHE